MDTNNVEEAFLNALRRNRAERRKTAINVVVVLVCSAFIAFLAWGAFFLRA